MEITALRELCFATILVELNGVLSSCAYPALELNHPSRDTVTREMTVMYHGTQENILPLEVFPHHTQYILTYLRSEAENSIHNEEHHLKCLCPQRRLHLVLSKYVIIPMYNKTLFIQLQLQSTVTDFWFGIS